LHQRPHRLRWQLIDSSLATRGGNSTPLI
jgi:hypothetical protein